MHVAMDRQRHTMPAGRGVCAGTPGSTCPLNSEKDLATKRQPNRARPTYLIAPPPYHLEAQKTAIELLGAREIPYDNSQVIHAANGGTPRATA